MTNSNNVLEREIFIDLAIETIVADIFKTMKYSFEYISLEEYINVISVMNTILEDDMKITYTRRTIEGFHLNMDHAYDNICRNISNSFIFNSMKNLSIEKYLNIQTNLNNWKQKYLSREKALEKYNTAKSTVVAKEEEKIDPNVDRTIANISDKLSSIIEKNDNNINCILVHAVKLGLLETAESINILKQENKKLKDEIEMLKKGNFNKNMKFSDSQIRSIKNMNRYGIDIKRIAMEYNCSINDIKNIIEE